MALINCCECGKQVSVCANVSALIEKIQKRDAQWFQYLRPQLTDRRVIGDSWIFVVRVFVREDNVEVIRRKFLGEQNVLVESIENIAFPWKWPWGDWSGK